ncbi:MAG: tetratricopeptide repeat protein [Parachlamydiaceae bacterium]
MDFKPILSDFSEKLNKYYSFHLFFLGAFLLELALLILLLPFLARSGVVALTLAALMVTIFGYLSIKSYREAAFLEEIKHLIDRYGSQIVLEKSADASLDIKKEEVASAYLEFAEILPIKAVINLPYLPSFIENYLLKYLDVGPQTLKEGLIKRAIQNRIESLKLKPTLSEKHALLSSAYLSLASFYKSLEKKKEEKDSLLKSAESLKILYVLNTQESHPLERLAFIFKELDDVDGEISVLEKWLQLEPKNAEPMLRLGQLYFNSGKSALGFKTYETLKSIDLKQSDELLKSFQF